MNLPHLKFLPLLFAAIIIVTFTLLTHIAAAAVQEAPKPFKKIAAGFSGQLDKGIALFLPVGLEPDKLPHSLCLVEKPRPRSPLAEGWNLQPEFSTDGKHHRVSLAIADGTSLYGTGEVTGPLLRNGTSITLWNTDSPAYREDNGRRLYQSHPWVLGVRKDGSAFGFLADSTWRAEMDLKSGIEFTSDGPLFPVILIERGTPQEVLQALAKLTGTIPLPPKWSLGYQQCRWSYLTADRVREVAGEFRKRKIPCDVMWMDIDYMDGFRDFTFNPKTYPDPKGLNDWLHERNFHSVWMIDPGVKAKKGYSVYDSGTAEDAWVKRADGTEYHGKVWPGMCTFPDFTQPKVRAWWAGLYKNFAAQGVDGVWNDMNEPAAWDEPGASGTMPLDNQHRGGGDLPPGTHAQYHNVYGMLETEATRDGMLAANPGKRPFVLTRASFLGGQRYATTWTGDNASTWEHFKMSIPMVMGLGLSGQPFAGPDIGGFIDKADAELWGHWIAVGAFYPFTRAHACHGTPDKEPWAFGQEVENAARTALERRYRLIPYLYTNIYESSLSGLPVMCPVFFTDAKDPSLRAEQQAFLCGGDLLVVPRWAKDPRLPKGIWRTVSLVGENSTTDKFQPDLKIRGGAIVPLGKVIQSTNEESLDPLTLLVCLNDGGTADGTLYEDAGDGFGYKDGDFLLTSYHAEKRGNDVVVRMARSDGKRARQKRNVAVEIVTEDGVVRGMGDEQREIVIPLRAN